MPTGKSHFWWPALGLLLLAGCLAEKPTGENNSDAQPDPWVRAEGPDGGTVRALAGSGNHLFAATEAGGVFPSTDSGASWKPANVGITNSQINVLATSGTRLYAGTLGGGVFVSANNGGIWSAVNKGMLPNPALCCVLAVSGTHLVAGTAGAGIWRRSLLE